MATITPVVGTNAGVAAPFTATASGGDEFVFGNKTTFIEFTNGHSSSITVSCAPTASTIVAEGTGVVSVPTRSVAIAAGNTAVFEFNLKNSSAYVNASGRIPFTYTGHNVLLVTRSVVTGA